jgi:hypothetical protein
VGVCERVGYLAEDAPCLVDPDHAVVVQALGEVVPADIRHHEEDEPFHLVDRVDVDDVGVVERGGGLGFAKEARADLASERELRRQDLDRDVPLEPPISRAVDDAHPAASDLGLELVVRREDALYVRAKLGINRRGYRIGHAANSATSTKSRIGAGVRHFTTGRCFWKGRLGCITYAGRAALRCASRRAGGHCGSQCSQCCPRGTCRRQDSGTSSGTIVGVRAAYRSLEWSVRHRLRWAGEL